MFPFFAPLSGDVAQAWATMLKSMSQVGLVNIVQQMRTDHPDLEEKIVREGFSYGQQLGRVNDVLEVLRAGGSVDFEVNVERARRVNLVVLSCRDHHLE